MTEQELTWLKDNLAEPIEEKLRLFKDIRIFITPSEYGDGKCIQMIGITAISKIDGKQWGWWEDKLYIWLDELTGRKIRSIIRRLTDRFPKNRREYNVAKKKQKTEN